MITNVTFTDPQGQTYTDAVIKVMSASRDTNTSTSESTRLSYDSAGEPSLETFNNSNTSDTVNCSFSYWPSQTAFDSGYAPYILINENGRQNFVIEKAELEKVEYAGLGLEQVCETYFQLNLV